MSRRNTLNFLALLFVLVGSFGCPCSVSAKSIISGYMYTDPTGVKSVPLLQAMKPKAIGNVYLKAADIDKNGVVREKVDGGHFYPHAWSGSSKPTFTALINVNLNINWKSGNPSTSLTSKLSANQWTRDYTGGITVDAEFPAGVDSFDGNWIAFLTDLRIFANNAGQDFSFYLSPKYLSPSRYTTAAQNLKDVASILGQSKTQLNRALFPVYTDTGTSVTGQTLIDAATAMKDQKNHYQWIHDISQSTTNFAEGMTLAHAANHQAGYVPNGASVYQYTAGEKITGNMKANLAALVGNPNSVAPEPTTMLIWSMLAGLGMTFRRRR